MGRGMIPPAPMPFLVPQKSGFHTDNAKLIFLPDSFLPEILQHARSSRINLRERGKQPQCPLGWMDGGEWGEWIDRGEWMVGSGEGG